jgi:hypothetical protein
MFLAARSANKIKALARREEKRGNNGIKFGKIANEIYYTSC